MTVQCIITQLPANSLYVHCTAGECCACSVCHGQPVQTPWEEKEVSCQKEGRCHVSMVREYIYKHFYHACTPHLQNTGALWV